MIQILVDKIHDAHFMTMLLAAVAASATAYTLVMPLFAGENLSKRMKAVANERERIRQRERERLGKTEKVSLRQSPKLSFTYNTGIPTSRARAFSLTSASRIFSAPCRISSPSGN